MQVIYFWVGYAMLMSIVLVGIVFSTRRLKGTSLRSGLIALGMAIFVAPSYVVKGYGIGPAWMAIVDARSPYELLIYGALPIVVTAAVVFGLLRIVPVLLRREKI